MCACLFRMIFQLLFTLFAVRKEHWCPYAHTVIWQRWDCRKNGNRQENVLGKTVKYLGEYGNDIPKDENQYPEHFEYSTPDEFSIYLLSNCPDIYVWRTGKPGMLQFMGSQRVRHSLAIEQQQKYIHGFSKESEYKGISWKL